MDKRKKLGFWAGASVGGILVVAFGLTWIFRKLNHPLPPSEAKIAEGIVTIVIVAVLGAILYGAWLLIKRFTDAPKDDKRKRPRR
jgi:hypothetical protein